MKAFASVLALLLIIVSLNYYDLLPIPKYSLNVSDNGSTMYRLNKTNGSISIIDLGYRGTIHLDKTLNFRKATSPE